MPRAFTSIALLLFVSRLCAAQSFDEDLAKLIQEREKQVAAINDAFLKNVELLKQKSLEKLKPAFEDAMRELDLDRSKDINAQMESIKSKRIELTTGKAIFAQNYNPQDSYYSYYVRMPRGIWMQLLPDHLFRFEESRFEKSAIEFAHQNSNTIRIRGKRLEHKMVNSEKQFKDGGSITWLTDVWVDGIPQPAGW